MSASGYNFPDYLQKPADTAPTRDDRQYSTMMVPPPAFHGSQPAQQMYFLQQLETFPPNVMYLPQNNTYYSHVEYRSGGQPSVVRQNSGIGKLGDVMHQLLRDILQDVHRHSTYGANVASGMPAVAAAIAAGSSAGLPPGTSSGVPAGISAGPTGTGGAASLNLAEQLQAVMVRPPLARAPVRPESASSSASRRSKRRSKFTREQDDLIVRMKRDGKLWVEIAEASGVGSYLAARNRYQVIVGQQGNNNLSQWTASDRHILQEALDSAELDKWRCIAAELTKASGRPFTSRECRDMVRHLFWADPASFGVRSDLVAECTKEQKITERALAQDNLDADYDKLRPQHYPHQYPYARYVLAQQHQHLQPPPVQQPHQQLGHLHQLQPQLHQVPQSIPPHHDLYLQPYDTRHDLDYKLYY